MIFKDSKLEKAKENEEYYATFSGEKLNFEGDTFNGASLNAIFGGIDLNLKKADIKIVVAAHKPYQMPVDKMYLPVQVGDTDGIVIHQIQTTDTGSCQGFHRVATHAPQAEHCHPGIAELLHRQGSQQHLRSEKLFVHK